VKEHGNPLQRGGVHKERENTNTRFTVGEKKDATLPDTRFTVGGWYPRL